MSERSSRLYCQDILESGAAIQNMEMELSELSPELHPELHRKVSL